MSWATRKTAWEFARGIILFFGGLAGITWETVHGPVDPSLLIVFCAMCGLEIVLGGMKAGK